MSKRKSEAFTQFVVGVFMIVVIALLGYFTIVVSGVDMLAGRSRTRLSVAFDQVGGLKDHDNVMYRGTKVGTVERIQVTPSNLVVVASVDQDVVMREDGRLMVCNLSMLGGNYLLAEEGVGERVDLEKTVFRGETPTDWMADFSRVIRNLREMTERLELNGIVTNLEAASVAARTVAQRVERGEGLVGKLTSSQDGLYDDIRSTVSTAKDTVANAKEITARFNRQKLADDVDRAVADFHAMCTNVAMAGSNIAKASRGVELKGSVDRANAFLDQAKVLTDNLNAVAAKLRAGEGTLGRLTSDEKMYQEVNGLIRDCRQIIDNYRDTTPISTFSSLAAGAL